MPFTLEHVLVSESLELQRHDTAQGFFFTVAARGSFLVLHPGRLQRTVSASVRHSMRIEVPDTQPPPLPHGVGDSPEGGPGGLGGGHPHPDPVPHPLHNGVQVTVEGIPLELRIIDPDGRPFTRDEVTLADLKKFRNLRGASRPWSFSVSGTSRTYQPVPALNETVTDPKGSLQLGLTETIASSSAPPLVSRTPLGNGPFRTTFDLNRVGDFVATVTRSGFISGPWAGSLRLLDPDGAEFARSGSSRLRCEIPLSALGRSRDASGRPRLWTLEAIPNAVTGSLGRHSITATVLAPGRINTAVLQSRIQRIFGPLGTSLEFRGANVGDRAQAILTISDVAAAETIDMHGLLDSLLKAQGKPTDVNAGTPLVLFSRESEIGYGAKVDVSSLKTTSINITVGPSVHLAPGSPVARIVVGVEGRVRVTGHGLTLATATVKGSSLEIEVGLKIDPDGTPRMVSWVRDEPFDIDLHPAAIATFIALVTAAGGLLGGVAGAVGGLIGGSLSAKAIEEAAEEYVNDGFRDGIKELFDDPTLAPRILMTILGAHMSYLPIRFDGSDILFEHIAPLEPEPKPRPNYAGAVGRSILQDGVGHTRFIPPLLGDTWKADNLKARIDHIVVVMMENRSYDHVLGYRSLAPTDPRDEADGWTPGLIEAVNAQARTFPTPVLPPEHADRPQEPVQPMRVSAFEPNTVTMPDGRVVRMRTRLPKPVGHELSDVAQQLGSQMDGPGGVAINDPSGFINNFREHKLRNNPNGEDLVVPWDCLRYYETAPSVTDPDTNLPVDDLPVFSFLAENFSYCDRYFCSHPGPTLPNRMFSLTGDVQYDRYGFPVLDNNDSDNFLLSRAQTIYDVLTRQGVGWRVYESDPSVTMLRMFARYAGDNLNIRPIADLEGDFAAGNVPPLVVIEPAMHHHPEDDDHPDADMYRGQKFIHRVYTALTSNPAVWEKTMLIITYDEHGGLYDHVVPPVAEVFEASKPEVADPGLGGLGGTLGGIATDVGATPTHGGTVGGATGGTASGLPEFIHIPSSLLDRLSEHELQVVEPDETVNVPYGVRVPTFVVSPWVPPGKGPSLVLDHCSILKTILARFCGETKPFLSDRVLVSHSFEAYLTEPQPRPVGPPPVLGDLSIEARRRISETSRIVTEPLFRKRMRQEQADYHEISGRLARMLGR